MENDREGDKREASSLSCAEREHFGGSDVETEPKQPRRKDFPICLTQPRNPPSAGMPAPTTSVSDSFSQSLESQPPGPSGVDLGQFPAVPTLSSTTKLKSGDEGHVVPLGGAVSEGEMPTTETQIPSLIFQMLPSQDDLRQGAALANLCFNNESTSMAHGPHASATLGATPSSSSVAVPHCRSGLVPQNRNRRGSSEQAPPNASSTQHEMSLLAEDLVQQSEKARLAAEQRQRNQQQGLVEYLSRRSGCEPPLEQNAQDTGGVAGSGRGGGDGGGGSSDMRDGGGLRNRLPSRLAVCVVPRSEGTDLSSEEGIQRVQGVFAREQRESQLAAVPHSSLVTTQVISFHGDQAVHLTATDSDTTSASERYRGQKVPSFTSRKMLELSACQHTREEEAQMKETLCRATGVERPVVCPQDSGSDEKSVASPTCTAIAMTTNDVSSNECSFDGLATTTTDISPSEQSSKRLAAGPPTSGAATGESSHEPATQTTSSAASEASHSPSPLWRQRCSSPELLQMESPPLAKQSPSPPHNNLRITSPAGEFVPSTLPSERPTVIPGIQAVTKPHTDLENELPNWCNKLPHEAMSLSRQKSSSSSESDNDKPPPPKRKRYQSRSSSSSDVQGCQREGNSDMQAACSTGQAHPVLTSKSMKQSTSSNCSPNDLQEPHIESSHSSDLPLTSSGSSVQPSSSPHTGSSGKRSVSQSTSNINGSGSSTLGRSSSSNDQPPSSSHTGSGGDCMSEMENVSPSCTKNAEAWDNIPCTSDSHKQKPNSASEARTSHSLVPLDSDGANSGDRPSQLLNDLFVFIECSEECQLDVDMSNTQDTCKQPNVLSDRRTSLCHLQCSAENTDINCPPSISAPHQQEEESVRKPVCSGGSEGVINLENTEETCSSQTQLIDSPELILDKSRLPGIPLRSPMKLPHVQDSVNDGGLDDQDTETMNDQDTETRDNQDTEATDDQGTGRLEKVKAESEMSLRLQLTQSQDLSCVLFNSFTEKRMSENSSLSCSAAQSNENLNESSLLLPLKEEDLDKTGSGASGDERHQGRVGDGATGDRNDGDGGNKDRIGDGGIKDHVDGGGDSDVCDGGGAGGSEDQVSNADGGRDIDDGVSKDRSGLDSSACDGGDSGGEGGGRDRTVCSAIDGRVAAHDGSGGSDGGGGITEREDKVKCAGDDSGVSDKTVGVNEKKQSKQDQAAADLADRPPAPFYESLNYDDLVENRENSPARILSSSPSTPFPTDTVKNNSELIDISQICSSGTSFEFQLPHDPVLQPFGRVTPPCKELPLLFTSKPTTEGRVGTPDAESPVQLSPSAVGADFFTRSVTPSSVQQQDATASLFEGNADMGYSCITSSIEEPDGCDDPPSSTASGAVVGGNSSTIMPLITTSLAASYLEFSRENIVAADQSTPPNFQLCTQADVQEPEVDYSSPPLLQLLDMPSDSHFELSEDPQLHLKAPNPSLLPSVTSCTDEEKNAHLATKSLLSDVATCQKVDMDVETRRSIGSEEKDPCVFNSGTRGSDMQVVSEGGEEANSSETLSLLDVVGTAERKCDELPISNEDVSNSIEMESKTSQTLPHPSVLISTVPQSEGFCLPLQNYTSTCAPVQLLTATLSTANRLSPSLPASLHGPMHTPFPRQPSPNLCTISPEFVSPSRTISSEGLLELKRKAEEQEGEEIGTRAHELRYMHTVCTVIEERFISSEVVENGAVVTGSEKFWPESSRPYTTQEIKVELLPRSTTGSPPSSMLHPTPSITLSPFTNRHTPSPILRTHSQFGVRSPSGSHLLPIPGCSGNVSSSGHALYSALSISHRSEDSSLPWKDASDGVDATLKLSDVPAKFKRSDSIGATNCSVGNNRTARTARQESVSRRKEVVQPLSSIAHESEENTNGTCSSDPPDEEECVDGVERGGVYHGMHKEPPMPYNLPLLRRAKGGTSISPTTVRTRPTLSTSPRNGKEKQPGPLSAPSRVGKQNSRRRPKKISANVRMSVAQAPLNYKATKRSRKRPLAEKAGEGETCCTGAHATDTSPCDGSKVPAAEEDNDGIGRGDLHQESPIPFTTPLSRKAKRTSLALRMRKSSGKQRSTLSVPTGMSKQGGSSIARKIPTNVKVSIQRAPCVKKPCLDNTTPSTRTSPRFAKSRRRNSDGVQEEHRCSNMSLFRSPEVGDGVIARWLTDKRWYAATVKDSNKNRKIELDYADGEKGSVGPNQLFSQYLLKKNEAVMAGHETDKGVPEINGLFEGFCGNERSFRLRMSCGTPVTCSTSSFSISQETALKYVRESRTPPHSRKRLSRQFSEQSPLTKKRKSVSISPRDGYSHDDDGFSTEDLESPSHRHLFQGYTFFLTQKLKENKQSRTPDNAAVNKQQMASLIINRKGKVLETYKDEKITDGRYFVLSDDCCRTQKYLLGLALAIPCISYTWITDCIKQGTVLGHEEYRLPAGIPYKRTTPISWRRRERSSILKGVQVYVHHHQNNFKERWKYVVKYSGATVLTKLPTALKMRSDKDTERCTRRTRSDLSVESRIKQVDSYPKPHRLDRTIHFSLKGSSEIVVVSANGCKYPASLRRCSGLYNITVLGTEWVVQCLVQGKQVDHYKDFVVDLKH